MLFKQKFNVCFLVHFLKDDQEPGVHADAWVKKHSSLLSYGRLRMRKWRMDPCYENWWRKGKWRRGILLGLRKWLYFISLLISLTCYRWISWYLHFLFGTEIVISAMKMWFGNISSESLERHNFIMKAFSNWVSFTENLPLFLWFLERQKRLQSCRREEWLWQTRNQIALLLGDRLLKDLSRNEERLNNKIRGHWPKRQLIVRTYCWRKISSFVSGPQQVEVSYWSTSLTTEELQ